MPSSTSSSDPRAATRAIAALLLGLCLYSMGLELVTRFGFSRVSRIQRRIDQDLRTASSLPPAGPGGQPTVLVVGNSLLLQGVDRASLKNEMAPDYAVSLLPIENTQFEDWYFGLQRLFSRGSHPSVVVALLTTRQMSSRSTDGEYFARFLMRPRDLLRVKRESQLDNTMTSAYFFANASAWLGSRGPIRNWLLQALMPDLEALISYFPPRTPPMPPPDQVVSVVLPHLRALDQLCRANGARLVVVVPPTLSRDDASSDVQLSAAQGSIALLVPFRPGEIPPADFGDGYHLNPGGAALFTGRLGPALLLALDNR